MNLIKNILATVGKAFTLSTTGNEIQLAVSLVAQAMALLSKHQTDAEQLISQHRDTIHQAALAAMALDDSKLLAAKLHTDLLNVIQPPPAPGAGPVIDPPLAEGETLEGRQSTVVPQSVPTEMSTQEPTA